MACKFKAAKKLNFFKMLECRMKGLNWSFIENWASTLVAVGGILATVLGSQVMPEKTVILSAQEFQFLNLLFPILIVVSAVSAGYFECAGKELRKNSAIILDDTDKTPLLILPFVAGSAVVAWAVIGELLTTSVLFQELYLADTISRFIAISAQIFLILLCILGLFYSIEKIVQISLSAKTLRN